MSTHIPCSGNTSQEDLAVHEASENLSTGLNRISEIRLSEGISLRTAAERMGIDDVGSVRQQQRATSDLLLSALYRWAALLDVDVPELIIDDAAPPKERISAHRLMLARWMKMVLSIHSSTPDKQIQTYSHRCIQNLLELRPDLMDIVRESDGPRLEQVESIGILQKIVFDPEKLHQINAVRRREGFTLRTVAKHMLGHGLSLSDLRAQEDPSTDLRITDIRRWGEALGRIPLSEFFPGSEESLSRESRERAIAVRLIKSLHSIRATVQGSAQNRISRLTAAIIAGLSELMPDVEQVAPWNAVGHKRTSDELGMAAERTLNLRELSLCLMKNKGQAE